MVRVFRRVMLIAAAACVAAAAASTANAASATREQQSKASPADETAIREIIRKYVDAREQQDPKAVEGLFTADADQLTSSGEWRKGRPDIVKGTLASSQSSGGKRTITIETVRLIAPNVAIADGRYEIAGLAGGATRSMWTSFTLARGSSSDGWRIAAIRNMLPAPPVSPAAPRPPTPPAPPK
jgi:uncharacterized protein (TIGR02246 family)